MKESDPAGQRSPNPTVCSGGPHGPHARVGTGVVSDRFPPAFVATPCSYKQETQGEGKL